jgi:membrane protein DedA with SNARE-associated domain
METFQWFLENYGYVALFVGTFLEGETILVLAGFAAHRGYLALPWVMLVAFAGTITSDQLFFYIGRRNGRAFLDKRPKWAARAQRVRVLLERHKLKVVLGFRYFYGLRNVTPLVIGASGFSPVEFLILNIIGGAIWATTVAALGYVFGSAVEAVLADVRRYEKWLFVLIAAVGFGIWLSLVLRKRARRPTEADREAGGTGFPPVNDDDLNGQDLQESATKRRSDGATNGP